MKTIIEQIREVQANWKTVYEASLANPSLWQPYLPNDSLVQLDEVMGTISIWFDRTRAPAGFSPGFHLAKAMASVYLPTIITTLDQLQMGNYNHFPNLINNLTNLLAAIHTMTVYSSKNEQENTIADFTAELAQALALLSTAQSELAEKANILEKSLTLADTITKTHSTIIEKENEIIAIKQDIETSKEEAVSNSTEIATYVSSSKALSEELSVFVEQEKNDYLELLEEHNEEYKQFIAKKNEETQALIDSNKKINDNIISMTEELELLQQKSKSQEAIIDSILPKGASAGLAAAFSQRVGELNIAKWSWMFVFIASIICLVIFSTELASVTKNMTAIGDYMAYIASRLPLAVPLIWLGWFSAIQYGNTIRVQEDYAFKVATSKAFQGYRDHMEHMKEIDSNGTQSALALLTNQTITILGHEPLRMYGQAEHDASPTHSFANIIKKKTKKPDEDIVPPE